VQQAAVVVVGLDALRTAIRQATALQRDLAQPVEEDEEGEEAEEVSSSDGDY
jgi:hypothetical protein